MNRHHVGLREKFLQGDAPDAEGFLPRLEESRRIRELAGPGVHANFQLSKSGDSIGLFAPNGTLVHAVSFGPQRTDVSQGLFPDGAASGYFPLSVPTPGRPNVFYRPQAEATNILPMPDGILIDWSVAPGRVYQLQFKDDLNDASWQVLGAEMTASTHSLSVFDPSLLAQGQRFYRLVLVR